MHFFDTVEPTEVYDSFWYFVAERQKVFFKKISGSVPPYTDDPILQNYKFTNVYRATDRTSQFAIKIMYEGTQSKENIFFRTMLFKLFNKIDTWQKLEKNLGTISYETFNIEQYIKALDSLFESGNPIYSAAYIMPSTRIYAQKRKHRNHVLLLADMMKDGLPDRISTAPSLQKVYQYLIEYPSIGPFLAYQYTIDLNYSSLINFSENDFVVAGPGARDGIRKCFKHIDNVSDTDIIRFLTEHQISESKRCGHPFKTLYGRPLHLIDIQNVFCEIGKYARVAHPQIAGVSNRTQIKQQYKAAASGYTLWFPPKWDIVTS